MKNLSRLLVFFDDAARQWLEQTQPAILMVDRNARVIAANSQQSAFTEKTAEQVQDRLLADVLPVRDSALLQVIRMVLTSGRSWRNALAIQGLDQQPREIAVAIVPLVQKRGEQGAIIFLDALDRMALLNQAVDFLSAHMVAADTDEIKFKSDARPESMAPVDPAVPEPGAAHLQSMILHSLPHGVALLADNDTILYHNDFFRNLYGTPTVAMVGRLFFDFIAPDHKKLWQQRLSDCRRLEKSFSFSAPLLTDPERTPVSWRHTLSCLQDRHKGTWLLLLTEKESAVKSLPVAQLVAAKQEAQQKMARVLSHDLRNELALMMHTISEMRKLGESPALQLLLDHINDQVKNVAEMAQRLRLIARDYLPDVMPINLSALLHAAVTLAELLCPRKGATLLLDIDDQAPEYYGNSEGLLSAFTALVVNALEAVASDGQVAVSMSFDVDSNGYQISITDNGVGITAEAMSKIFDMYYTTKPGKSAGQSLAMVYRVVQQHLGIVQFTSEPNVGSQVRVSLPAKHDSLPWSDWGLEIAVASGPRR
jgi:signal transduction histidine kinase